MQSCLLDIFQRILTFRRRGSWLCSIYKLQIHTRPFRTLARPCRDGGNGCGLICPSWVGTHWDSNGIDRAKGDLCVLSSLQVRFPALFAGCNRRITHHYNSIIITGGMFSSSACFPGVECLHTLWVLLAKVFLGTQDLPHGGLGMQSHTFGGSTPKFLCGILLTSMEPCLWKTEPKNSLKKLSIILTSVSSAFPWIFPSISTPCPLDFRPQQYHPSCSAATARPHLQESLGGPWALIRCPRPLKHVGPGSCWIGSSNIN